MTQKPMSELRQLRHYLAGDDIAEAIRAARELTSLIKVSSTDVGRLNARETEAIFWAAKSRLNAPKVELRLQVVRLIAVFGPRSRVALMDVLLDSSSQCRKAAVRLLPSIPEREVGDALLRVAKRDPSPDVREAAGTAFRAWLSRRSDHNRIVPLDEVALSVRGRRVLERLGVRLIGDAADCSETDLHFLYGVGRTVIRELQQVLNEHGLTLLP